MALSEFAYGEGALKGAEDDEGDPDAVDVHFEGEGEEVSDRQTDDPLCDDGIHKRWHGITCTS